MESIIWHKRIKLIEFFIFGICIIVWYFNFYYNHRIKMDIEETKRIIQNKIEADEAAREVRRQIKTYIHENKMREKDLQKLSNH